MHCHSGFLTKIQPLCEHQNNLCLRLAQYDITQYQPNLWNQLYQPAPTHIQQACLSRQASFLAGRLLAKICLQALQSPQQYVKIGRHKEPCWPIGYTGSITHKDNTVAVMAASAEMGHMGVDYEHWLPQTKAMKLAPAILSPHEYQLNPRDLNEKQITLCFSAKETLFKALYPQVQAHFGFQAAQITSVQWQQGTYQIELLEQLTPSLLPTQTFLGHFHPTESGILTWMRISK